MNKLLLFFLIVGGAVALIKGLVWIKQGHGFDLFMGLFIIVSLGAGVLLLRYATRSGTSG